MNSPQPILTELQDANRNLSSRDPKVRFDSLKQVVHLFGQGENCSISMPQTVNFQSDDNVTMHRYVNIINDAYLKENPSLSEAVALSIVNDFQHSNPLIQALAVKQAGSVVDIDTAAMLIPIIKAGAASNDPYIRKAAGIAILKAHSNSPLLLYKYELPKTLCQLIEDTNPNVAANAISAFVEIRNTVAEPLMKINFALINSLLSKIEEATEWSQIQILEFVCNYRPESPDIAKQIIQKMSTRLIQANSGITIIAVRCCLKMCMYIDNQEYIKEVFNKIMLSLIALTNNETSIQYTVMKSIFVILQKFRNFYDGDIAIFFCNYDDPLCIKLEKIDIILTLTNDKNIKRVLDELKGYAQEEDIEFVRKSIRAIGRLAIVFESAVSNCVECLESLFQSRIPDVVQECIVVSVNIFRKYPKQCERILQSICQIKTIQLDDHRAKAALVWILGEYPSIITNPDDYINSLFFDSFLEEPTDVQLSILTAVVKFFLNKPDEEQQRMLSRVLSLITNEVNNPDLKDRAYMYLCLLTKCWDKALDVVMNHDPPVSKIDLQMIDPRLVDRLFPLVGSLAVIYKQIPQEFVPTLRHKPAPPPESKKNNSPFPQPPYPLPITNQMEQQQNHSIKRHYSGNKPVIQKLQIPNSNINPKLSSRSSQANSNTSPTLLNSSRSLSPRHMPALSMQSSSNSTPRGSPNKDSPE